MRYTVKECKKYDAELLEVIKVEERYKIGKFEIKRHQWFILTETGDPIFGPYEEKEDAIQDIEQFLKERKRR